MAHHTKDKGDLGVAKAIADLTAQGFMVLIPMTEHAPFDLVVYTGEQFIRVQVKYRSCRAGAVSVVFRSMWADRHGTHRRRIDKALIDVVCIYCPEVDECFYIWPANHGEVVNLRVFPARNGQSIGVHLAESYRRLVLPQPLPLQLALETLGPPA